MTDEKKINNSKNIELQPFPKISQSEIPPASDQTIRLPKELTIKLASYNSLEDSISAARTKQSFRTAVLEERERKYNKSILALGLKSNDSKNGSGYPYYHLSQYQGVPTAHVRALEAIKQGKLQDDVSFLDLTTIKDNNGKDLAWWMRHLYNTNTAYAHFKPLLDHFFSGTTESDKDKQLDAAVICGQEEIIEQIVSTGTNEQRSKLLIIACANGELELMNNVLAKINSPSKELINKAFITSCLAGHADIAKSFFEYDYINVNVTIGNRSLIDIVAGKGYFALAQLLLEKGVLYHIDYQKKEEYARGAHGVSYRVEIPGHESSVDASKNNIIKRAMLIEKINRILTDKPKLKSKTVDMLLEALENGKPVDKIKGTSWLTGELRKIYKKALSLPADGIVFSRLKTESWLRMKFSDDKKSISSLDNSNSMGKPPSLN